MQIPQIPFAKKPTAFFPVSAVTGRNSSLITALTFASDQTMSQQLADRLLP
jgi:phage terminase large subunit-like protein